MLGRRRRYFFARPTTLSVFCLIISIVLVFIINIANMTFDAIGEHGPGDKLCNNYNLVEVGFSYPYLTRSPSGQLPTHKNNSLSQR